MPSASKPWWQQATALVSLGAGGAVTGLSFVPRPAAELTSPASLPVHLMALEEASRPTAADDGALRSAIVNVANYYRRMAETKTPAEMEALIWQHDSADGADHGESCAAFASLTLELGAHVTGQHSWVTGGSSYPWPLHDWVDARVNPNPASPNVTSIVQDAEAHHRWHAVGDGYQPLPGDWVVFDGHVEVVTKDAGGVLATIGGDSVPNFSVNAHAYRGPLASQGVVGFVNNGSLPAVADKVSAGSNAAASAQQPKQRPNGSRSRAAAGSGPAAPADLPVAAAPTFAAEPAGAQAETAIIPGLPIMAHRLSADPKLPSVPNYSRHNPAPPPAPAHGASSEQAFISQIAPGAIAAQRKYGVPASVTIAQAIDESGWGQSTLATKDHNLFGIKGTGPAGSDALPTQEYQNGQLVTSTNSFRVYGSTAESIDDHGRLLATSGYYGKSMANRRDPNAFAQALTGIYATDPGYGTKLIGLMRQYDLYRYDVASSAAKAAPTDPVSTAPAATSPGPAMSPGPGANPAPATSPAMATIPGLPVWAPSGSTGAAAPSPAPTSTAPQSASPPATPSGAPAAGNGSAGSHQPGPSPTLSGPTPAASRQAAAPTPTAPSAAQGHAPSGRTSTGPTGSAAPSRPAATRRSSGRPAPAPAPRASSRTAQAAAQPPRPRSSAGSSRPAATAPPSGATSPAPTRSEPAPAWPPPPAPSAAGPAQSGRAHFRSASSASARSAPSSTGRPASASSAAPTASRAPSAPNRAAQPSSPPSPAVPGLPAAAAAPSGSGRADQAPAAAPQAEAAVPLAAAPAALTVYAGRMGSQARRRARRTVGGHAYKPAARYRHQMPPAVRNAFVGNARVPLLRAEPLYQDVASYSGIRWELLAACDWMQCEARARYSPVHGEKLGTVNPDGMSYHTRSEALEQCAEDLVELAETVYGIDLTAPAPLSVRDLANAFAAFRWGALLRLHRTSAMEFPYSVAGLTPQHTRMRWPKIADPNTPDRPGSRFRKPFGAVPIVLSLNYPATV